MEKSLNWLCFVWWCSTLIFCLFVSWTNHGVLGLALLSSRGTSSSLYFNSSTPVRYPTLVLYIKQNIIVTLRTTVF